MVLTNPERTIVVKLLNSTVVPPTLGEDLSWVPDGRGLIVDAWAAIPKVSQESGSSRL